MSFTVSYMVACCLSSSLWSHGVAACLSLYPMVAASAVSHCFSRPMDLLHVSHCLPWLLVCLSQCHGVATCLSLSFMVAVLAVSHCHSGPIELLHVSHCLLSLLAVPHCLLYGCWLSITVSFMVPGYLSLSLWSHRIAACL